MHILELSNIQKNFDSVKAVDGVSLNVNEGEFVVLLGPSGCGKTTILRMVAGFIHLDGGSIKILGKEVSSRHHTIPPNLRDVSMVFQNYAIWPHMTVFDNVAYGLKIRKTPKKEIRDRVMDTLKMVQIDDYSKRYSHELSGGQQQRVALARALVVNPKILLMDEPLSNLDAKLRLEMRIEIKELQMRLKCTTIYVTHDQAEAMVLGDQILLLGDGKIRQQGKPSDLYQFPNSSFSALFFGATNLINCTVKSIDTAAQALILGSAFGNDVRIKRMSIPISEFKTGDNVCVSIRGEAMKIFEQPPEKNFNYFKGKIDKFIYLGECYDCEIKVGDTLLKAQCGIDQKFKLNQEVYIGFSEEALGACCFKEA